MFFLYLSHCYVTALDISSTDIKALFRRVQGLEQMGQLTAAYSDARRLYQSEPNNKAVQEICYRLRNVLEVKVSCLGHCAWTTLHS